MACDVLPVAMFLTGPPKNFLTAPPPPKKKKKKRNCLNCKLNAAEEFFQLVLKFKLKVKMQNGSKDNHFGKTLNSKFLAQSPDISIHFFPTDPVFFMW